MRDVRETIKSVRLHRRQDALMLSTGESSGRNPNDCANIPELATEVTRQNLERGVRQAVANGFEEVRSVGDGPENLSATEKSRDTSWSRQCHMASMLPPDGSAGNDSAG